MAKDKNSFILYIDSIEIFEQLTDEKAGLLIKHIFRYVNDKDPISDDPIINIAFTPIKQYLKRDLKKYESIVVKRVEAGKASANKRQQVSTSVESVQQTSTNPTVSDSVIVSDSVSDSVKEKKKVFIKPTFLEIQSYCEDRKNNVSPEKWLNHYEANGWMVGKNKMKDWKAAVRTWENNTKEVIQTPDNIYKNPKMVY